MSVPGKEVKVVFVDENLKEAYEKLKDSTTEDKRLYKWLNRAFDDIKEDYTCGILIPKKFIPSSYIKKYGIDNCWKYDLPSGWRLLYSVKAKEILILAIIIEWLSHKKYERRFNY
jgi:hypothetical protein